MTANAQSIVRIQDEVRSDLEDNVLPFWTRNTLDNEHGGFLTVVDRQGRPTSNTTKFTIMQARMIWTLAAAHAFGISGRGYLHLARHSVEFLIRKAWDQEHGGFFMSTDRAGTPLNVHKYLYCQEFVLYAFAQFSIASGESGLLGWTGRIFDLIEEKTVDPDHGGHREDFDRAWNPVDKSLGVTGARSLKTVNTHMHLMEAYTALVLADPQPRYKAALAAITDLLLTRCVHESGYAIEPQSVDWHPLPDGKGRLSVFYGHDVELAWLLMDSYRALGRPIADLKTTVLSIIDRVLATGFDHERGGIASQGPRDGSLWTDPLYAFERSGKGWWEQAEALVALIRAYRWTGDDRYWSAFEKQWDWVRTYQIDHEAGDWFATVDWTTGAPIDPDDKGLGGWKVCYHNGRALMNVADELSRLAR